MVCHKGLCFVNGIFEQINRIKSEQAGEENPPETQNGNQSEQDQAV